MVNTSASPLLELCDIRAGYDTTEVLHGVSVTVPRGGVTAIIGHNGAGKTTLLRTAVGLISPTSGKVIFDGEDITALRANQRVKRGCGYVPQGQVCFEQMTARENLRVVADGRRRGTQLIDQALDTFPALVPMLDRKAGLLSGGQRQQLAIARALITEPRLLILDEPTEGIQPNVVAEIENTIVALAERGDLSVVLVEQHVGFSLRASSQFCVVDSGRIVHSGDSADVSEMDIMTAMAI